MREKVPPGLQCELYDEINREIRESENEDFTVLKLSLLGKLKNKKLDLE